MNSRWGLDCTVDRWRFWRVRPRALSSLRLTMARRMSIVVASIRRTMFDQLLAVSKPFLISPYRSLLHSVRGVFISLSVKMFSGTNELSVVVRNAIKSRTHLMVFVIRLGAFSLISRLEIWYCLMYTIRAWKLRKPIVKLFCSFFVLAKREISSVLIRAHSDCTPGC